MKKYLVLCLAVAAIVPAQARNTTYKLPLADVLQMPEAKVKLDGSVKFFFGENTIPQGAERKGVEVIDRHARVKAASKEDFAACRGRSAMPTDLCGTQHANDPSDDDVASCKAAALQALIALQDNAKRRGANAVVDFVSDYKGQTFSSATEYECHAGATGGHLTFKANYASVPKQ